MMGVALYYEGPKDSITVKPDFYTSNNDQHIGFPIETETMMQNTYSTASVFSGYSVEINRSLLSDRNLVIKCIAKVYVDPEAMEISDEAPSRNIPFHKYYIKDFKFSDKNK